MSANILLVLMMLLGTVIVLGRCIELSALLSRKGWMGNPFQFVGFSVSVALTAGGAVGVLFFWGYGQVLLLLGIAGWFYFNRRL
jgi:hypothetical protein